MNVNDELYFLKSNTIGPHTRANAAERRNDMTRRNCFQTPEKKTKKKNAIMKILKLLISQHS